MPNFKPFDSLNKHFQENFWLYVISLLCLSTGLVLGIYTVKYMGEVQKSDLTNYFVSFTDYMRTSQVNKQSVLLETVKNNIPIIIALWILGFTAFSVPVVLIVDLIKGFTLGFTLAFIMNGIGIKGIWISLSGVIPQNLIYLPCTVFASVFSMEASISKLKNRLSKSTNGYSSASSYSFSFVMITLLMVLGFIIEAYFTPNVLKLIITN